jgi:hypothetical protein
VFKIIVPGVNYWVQFREKLIETGKRNIIISLFFLNKKKKEEDEERRRL